MKEWHDFLVAASGAAAALTGLIFVGVSINLNRILSIPTLVSRASISMVLLLAILIVALFLLSPADHYRSLGMGILILGLLEWMMIMIADIRILKKKEKPYRVFYLLNLFLNQVATIPYLIGGSLLLNENVHGMYWLMASIIFSFIKASIDAWVLLVEINR
jgi:hypothetical protein